MSAAGERASWAELARSAALGGDETAPEEIRQLLVFEVAGGSYALPVECVREIVRLRPTTPIPRAPQDVCGVIALRGEIVQVLDTRRRLGLPPAVASPRSRVIVMNGDDGDVTGLLVDGVHEVLRVEEAELRAPTDSDGGVITALAPRGERFVSLLSPEHLVGIDAAV
jgi:purine-binding chemotaxis protein CheW